MNLMPIIHNRHAFRYLTVTTDIINRDTFYYVNFIPVNTEQTHILLYEPYSHYTQQTSILLHKLYTHNIQQTRISYNIYICYTQPTHILLYELCIPKTQQTHTFYELYTRYIHDRYTSTM